DAVGARGGAPVDRRGDAAAPDPQAKSATPTLRNAAPPSGPVAKAFPESWREDLAGADKAFRKTLDRFDNPAALAKAYKELTARLSSGDLKATKPPPDNATPSRLQPGAPNRASRKAQTLMWTDCSLAMAQ